MSPVALASDALSRISLEPFHLTPRSTTAGGIFARQYLAIALALFVVLGLAGCLEPPAGEGTLYSHLSGVAGLGDIDRLSNPD